MKRADREHRGIRRWLSANTIGLSVLIGATAVSAMRVMSIREELFDPNVTIIRIAHWQLELGYRDALQAVIDEYERLHPGVRVKQMYMTEKIYGQWLNTHLISGTAPDIAELGMSNLATSTQYLARFFLPLTELVDEPNPYNAGTDLEQLRWRETFIDGMRGAYRSELQDYFGVAASVDTIRVYYNRNLMHAATGSDSHPRTFQELLDACNAIRQYARKTEKSRRLAPIAASRYNAPIFVDRYLTPFTAGLEPQLDLDLDGDVSGWEFYCGFLTGKVGFDHPNIRAYYECTRKLSEQFNAGFMAMDRDDATFMFIQQNAVMVASGSWDANSLFEQADFEVGVFDFPIPRGDEPWAALVAGRANEAGVSGGSPYGIYKGSPNVDQAVDFLRFLTCRRQNARLNRKAGWLPVVVGADPAPRMKPFMPDANGYSTSFHPAYGSHARTVLKGQEWKYYSGETDYDQLAQATEQAMRDPRVGADKAWAREYDDMRRWCRNQERLLAVQSSRMLMLDRPDAPDKLRRALLQQLLENNGEGLRHRFEQTRAESIEAMID